MATASGPRRSREAFGILRPVGRSLTLHRQQVPRMKTATVRSIVSVPSFGKTAKPRKPRPIFRCMPTVADSGLRRFGARPTSSACGRTLKPPWRSGLPTRTLCLPGRDPAPKSDELTVKQLVNAFLTDKKRHIATGELKQRSWDDYDAICGRILTVFGPGRLVADLRPTDFVKLRTEFAKTHGPVALSNDIGRARVVFNYAYKQDLVDRPPKYGDGFKKPSRKVLRCERQKKGPRMFQADQTSGDDRRGRRATSGHDPPWDQLRLRQHGLRTLPLKALDLEKGWVDFGRPKTGVHRRCPLWADTVRAHCARQSHIRP